jgi:baseplate J-like protein
MSGPIISVDDLTTPLTRQEVQAFIYSGLATLGVNTTLWKSGSPLRTLIVVVSALGAAFTSLMAAVARSGFLELTAEDWLTLVAHYVYGIDRDLATFATGVITLVNSGGGVYTLDPGDLIIASGASGKTYRNTASISLGAMMTNTNVPIQATESGSGSNALGGEINVVVTSTLAGVACTNPSAIVGLDDELDSDLKTRCNERLGALSPFGPWDAYSSAVKGATRADGSSVGVKRVRLTKDGAGGVTVYCATKSGAVTSPDLVFVDTAVQTKAAPQSITALTVSATEHPIDVTYEAWAYNTSGRSPSQIETTISQALTAFFATQPIGGNIIDSGPGKVFAEAIRAAIGASLPEIFHAVITAPSGDTTLMIGEVPTLGSIVPTAIHQLPPPQGYTPA